MKIYRIQDKRGRGPFEPGMADKWLNRARAESERPNCFEDFGDGIIFQMRAGFVSGCGFPSLEKLRFWFDTGERARLKALGYFIVQLDAEVIVAESKTQLLFWRRVPLNVGAVIIE